MLDDTDEIVFSGCRRNIDPVGEGINATEPDPSVHVGISARKDAQRLFLGGHQPDCAIHGICREGIISGLLQGRRFIRFQGSDDLRIEVPIEAVTLALSKRALPPTAGYSWADPELRLSASPQNMEGAYALVNCFGCDGNNAALVLKGWNGYGE